MSYTHTDAGKDNFHIEHNKEVISTFYANYRVALGALRPLFSFEVGVVVQPYSLLLNLTFPRNLIHHLLILGDCGKRIVLKSQ